MNPSAVAAPITGSEDGHLIEHLSHLNLVSVAFYEQDKCTELISRIALFDSGSPVSTVKRSYVPFLVNSDRKLSGFRGMGNKTLSMYGFVKCQFVFREHIVTHNFLVLPDEEAAVDLLVGRDLLKKMNIKLCQIKEIKYSFQDLLKLNKAQIPNKTVVSALELFNLFKSPENELTVPQLGKREICKSDPEIY